MTTLVILPKEKEPLWKTALIYFGFGCAVATLMVLNILTIKEPILNWLALLITGALIFNDVMELFIRARSDTLVSPASASDIRAVLANYEKRLSQVREAQRRPRAQGKPAKATEQPISATQPKVYGNHPLPTRFAPPKPDYTAEEIEEQVLNLTKEVRVEPTSNIQPIQNPEDARLNELWGEKVQ